MDDRVEPFTDGQALAWLLARPQAQIETTISDLARRWGWNRTKVLRRLRRWAPDGHIVRALEPSGRSVITAMSSSVHHELGEQYCADCCDEQVTCSPSRTG